MNVTLTGGYVPVSGESFIFFTATGGINGTFATVNLPSGYAWILTYNSNNVTLLFNGPLPAELTTFTATPLKNKVNLNWATASEQNNDRFEIEHSADADRFLTNQQYKRGRHQLPYPYIQFYR